jgi:two-component system NtrC family response regulator
MATVLIVDDDAALREGLAEALADLGHRPVEVADGRNAPAAARRHAADAVLLDLRMPGIDGLEVLRRLRAAGPAAPPVAVLTAYASAANTIEAMRLGAFDHLTKPVGRDELADLLGRMVRPDREERGGATPPDIAADDELVGADPAMRDVQKTIGLVADSDATVLIAGETGSGKEVVARAIHRHGRRGAGPFVAVNCAAIPAGLLESELFGHVRGAFTGAVADRNGAFRDAHRGTLFLDEIGDMPLDMQAKLLRVLQERTVVPVGGRPARIDVRVIAATHCDLPGAVRAGRFREDLYYRLDVVPLRLPALRDRRGDIVPLAEHFLRRYGAAPKRLTGDAAARLLAHSWPGNVRELKNAMERAAVLSRGDAVAAADLDFLAAPQGPDGAAVDWTAGDLPTAVARLEAHMIGRALRETGGNRAEAARRLGIHRQLLYAKAQRYGIDAASGERTESVRNADEPAHGDSKNMG